MTKQIFLIRSVKYESETTRERESLPETPELNVLGVEINEYRAGIPLAGWDSVESALNTFASGASRGSCATEDHNFKAYSEMGPLSGILFLRGNNKVSGSSFVDEMLEEAKTGIQNRGKWRRSYDYDGQGVFHKTSVEITALKEPKDAYLLSLNAAYVGKEVEDGLAAHLGVEQGLQRKSAKIQIEPNGELVQIDFDQALSKLKEIKLEKTTMVHDGIKSLLNLVRMTDGIHALFAEASPEQKEDRGLTGQDVVNYFMATDKYGSEPDPLVLGSKGEVELALSLGVGRRFTYDHGQRSASQWEGKGSVLTAPVGTDYEDKSVVPYLNIVAQRASEEKYSRLPLVDPQSKQVAEDLISAVARAFQS